MQKCVTFLTIYRQSDSNHLQLDEDGLREKKKQKLMKAGFDARLRVKREKEKEKEEREAEEKREEEERQTDLSAWVDKTRKQQEVRIHPG
jgi:actin-related protein 5